MTQATFLGASVIDFNCTVGWNESNSTLSVNLVVDPTNSDTFLANLQQIVGTPRYFGYGGFSFGGIVQNWNERSSVQGQTYSVILNDPRELLGNVQVIINKYSGSVSSIPNLINAYGYLESQYGFGASLVNEAGMPWSKIVQALNEIFNGGNSSYGTSIAFMGAEYLVDLRAMPSPPTDYRIGGGSINLLEAISQVCRDCGHDFYVELVTDGGRDVIRVRTVSRVNPPVLGQINRFIATTQGAVSKERGVELRNEPTTTFLTGGAVNLIGEFSEDFSEELEEEAISFYTNQEFVNTSDILHYKANEDNNLSDEQISEIIRFYNEGVLSKAQILRNYSITSAVFNKVINGTYGNGWRTDGTIWPFWGINEQYNVVRGITKPSITDGDSYYTDNTAQRLTLHAVDDRHEIYLDARDVDVVGVGSQYGLYAAELRAALESEDAWENFVTTQSVLATDQNNIISPYFGRHILLDICGEKAYLQLNNNLVLRQEIVDKLQEGFGKPTNLKNFSKFAAQIVGAAIQASGTFSSQKNKSKLYDYVSQFASEYYARKYMVRLDDVSVLREPGTGRIISSHEIAEGGWTDGAPLGLPPSGAFNFTLPDGRYSAFARFIPGSAVDTSRMNKEDYVLQGDYLYVRGNVDSDFVFGNKTSLDSPRAVFTLASPVHYKISEDDKALVAAHAAAMGPGAAVANLQRITSAVGGKIGYQGIVQPAMFPDAIAIPLRDNTNTYGPWYVTGAVGKVNYEDDESFAPWNYGGTANMNAAAENRIRSNLSSMQLSEAGTITVPGTPGVQLGDVLIAGGPNVTSINCNIGPDGATTTYTCQTYTPSIPGFGLFSKTIGERIGNQSKRLQQQQRQNAFNAKTPGGGSKQFQNRQAASLSFRNPIGMTWDKRTKRVAASTPHEMFVGQYITPIDGSGQSPIVVTEPTYEMLPDLRANDPEIYKQRAACSLDFLLRPFSTDPEATGIPHFEVPTSSTGSEITASSLNPFKKGHDIEFVTTGDEYPEEGLSVISYEEYPEPDDYRAMALRGPLVVTGWGYTTEGKPIPNRSGDLSADEFKPGYLREPQTWPCGPVDLRWDNDRKVWSAISSPEFPKDYTGLRIELITAGAGSNTDNGRYNYNVNSRTYPEAHLLQTTPRSDSGRGDRLGLVPYNSNYISLYDGSDWHLYKAVGNWEDGNIWPEKLSIPDSRINVFSPGYIASSGLDAGATYNVFCELGKSRDGFETPNTPRLFLVNDRLNGGTNASGNIIRDNNGIWCLGTTTSSGYFYDSRKRYLGCIRTDYDSKFVDKDNKRFVYNWYNKRMKHISMLPSSVSTPIASGLKGLWGGPDGKYESIQYLGADYVHAELSVQFDITSRENFSYNPSYTARAAIIPTSGGLDGSVYTLNNGSTDGNRVGIDSFGILASSGNATFVPTSGASQTVGLASNAFKISRSATVKAKFDFPRNIARMGDTNFRHMSFITTDAPTTATFGAAISPVFNLEYTGTGEFASGIPIGISGSIVGGSTGTYFSTYLEGTILC